MTKSRTLPVVCSIFAALLLGGGGVSAFSVDVSRREAIQAAFAGAAAIAPSLVSVLPANAMPDEETPRVITRMGGLLVGGLPSLRKNGV